MKRRSRAGGEPVKTRRQKTLALKRRNARKVARHRESSAAGLNKKASLFKRERDEALEQLSAASEVLKVISSSPGELKPVFQTILENAARICQAQFGTLVGKPSVQMQNAGKGIDFRLRHRWPSVACDSLLMRVPPGPLKKRIEVGREQPRSTLGVTRQPE